MEKINEKKPAGYWTYERCYEAAKECNTKSELYHKYSGAYSVALKNGWLDDYTWFLSEFEVRSKAKSIIYKWTKEKCYEAAKKCNTRSEYNRKYCGAYSQANKNNWLKDYVWLKGRDRNESVYCVYVYEDVPKKHVYVGLTNNLKRRDREHRKGVVNKGIREYDYLYKYFNGNVPEPKVKIDTITADDASYYEGWYANKYVENGWVLINKAKTGSLGTAFIKWTKEKCNEEAKKYKTRTEFCRKSSGAYNAALKHGWIDDFVFEEIRKPCGYWQNYDNCYKEASMYKTRGEFQHSNYVAYDYARKKGWLKDYTWFIGKRQPKKWTYNECYKEAKKYKTRAEFQRYRVGAYTSALNHKWLDDYTWFEQNYKPNGYWNDYYRCKDEASKFSRRVDFLRQSNSAYNAARRNGWLDDFFPKVA